MKDEVQETEKRLETLSGKVADAMRVEKKPSRRGPMDCGPE
jgi:hypothetical protein